MSSGSQLRLPMDMEPLLRPAARWPNGECRDCGIPTMSAHEYYMVHCEIWEAAEGGDGFLCIGCLEERIGRRLGAEDFQALPVNEPEVGRSARLADRLG